jgi:ABC-2 type transport system permease protein
LFDRFGNLRGWTLAEIGLLYGIANTAFALAESFGRGFDMFSGTIKAGDFDRLLLRPRSTALQVAGQDFQFLRFGRLLNGIVALGWSTVLLEVAWTPAKLLLLTATIGGGACVFYGLFVLQATLCFWTVESLEIMNTVTYGGTETAQYPLTIYRPWFRRFFTFVVPLACMNYIPASAILNRTAEFGIPMWLPWLAPLVGIAFLFVCLHVWRFGERRYRSTGS